MFRTVLVIAFWVVLTAGAGPIYKWVDEAGNVHYSDQPRPQVSEPEKLMPASAPVSVDVREAEEMLDRLLASQQTSQDRQSATQEQERTQGELDQAQQVDRQQRCILFRDYLYTLELEMPGYIMNEKRVSVLLDAEERTAEIERSRAEINKLCG